MEEITIDTRKAECYCLHMDIIQYTLWSVSVAATLFSVVLVATLICGVAILNKIRRILNKLEEISDIGVETSQTVKSFFQKTSDDVSHAINAFVTVRGASEIVSYVGEAINLVRNRKQKKEQESE